jgi:short-subunit dehydrogenase
MSYALITGASKGIGKAMAHELASRKVNLLLVARSGTLLDELAATLVKEYGIEAACLAVDLSSPNAPADIFNWVNEHQYPVNILINNAGYGLSGDFASHTAAEHGDMMRVNMRAPVELTSLLLPLLREQKAAYILNVASSAAYQAVPGLSVYAASKAFIVSFSRGLAHELRNTPISVTVVSPGGTDTDFANRAQVSEKAVKAGERLNMTAEAVAKIAITAMFARKKEVITGFVNKLGALLVWLLPKKLVETTAASIYEKH